MQEMKYFNEGNDCDICKNQLMTGRDGTVEDCRRRQNGLSCRFEERDIRTCPVCEHEVDREDMYFTKDCHGIPFRLVCDRCMSSRAGAYRTGVLIMGKSTSRGGFSETKRTANMFSRWIFDTFSRVLTMMS